MLNRRAARALFCTGVLGVAAGLLAGPAASSFAAPRFPTDAVLHHAGIAWSPDDATLAFAAMNTAPKGNHRLYTVSSAGGEPKAVFEDDHSYQTPSWSPDGKRLAFASDRGGGWRIWTATPTGEDVRLVTLPSPSQDLMPAWSPDGATLAYSTGTRSGPVLMIVPASGGTPTRVAAGWRPRWSPDGTRLAYVDVSGMGFGRREGVAIRQLATGEVRRLDSSFEITPGWAHATDWSADGRSLIYTRRSGPETELTVIDLSSGGSRVIARLQGTVTDLAWSHRRDLIAYMSITSDHPGEVHLVAAAGGTPVAITHQRQGVRARFVEYPSSDGTRIPSWLYEPPGVRGCPALVWVHGGAPGDGLADPDYDQALQYFAAQGYVVLAINHRGSVGYGDAIATLHAGKLEPVADIIAAAQFLKTLRSVDAGRLGIIGFSAGGYWTSLTLGRAPGVFRAGVDFSGPSDLLHAAQTPAGRAMYEPFLGSPTEHEAEYRQASPITYVSQIATPLLIVHGTSDRVVLFDQSQRLYDALRAAGKPVQLLRLTGGHDFEGSENATAFETAAVFLATHLR